MPQTYTPARIFMNNYLSFANGYISMFALEMTQKKKGPTYLFDIESPLILRENAYIDNFRDVYVPNCSHLILIYHNQELII